MEEEGDGRGALQNWAERLDLRRGPMGEVGEGAVVDLAILTEGFAEQDRRGRRAIGDHGHIHVDIIA